MPRNNSHRLQIFPFLIALLPLVALVALIFKYKVDVPFLDEWDLVPLVDKYFQGSLTFHDLWEQHNEHRLFFPRAVLIPLIALTQWNVTYLLMLNLAVAAATLFLFHHQIRKTLVALGDPRPGWWLPVLFLFVFSFQQSDSWLMVIQITHFLHLFAITSGIFVLAIPTFRWINLGAACLLGLVGTYSIASGILFWPVCLFILNATSCEERKSHRLRLFLWTLLGLAVILSYLYHYHKPPHHPSVWTFVSQPWPYLRYVFTFLGASLINFNLEGAFWAGVTGGVFLTAATTVLVRRTETPLAILLPYISLALFLVGAALMAGVGRAGFGINQAMVPRYATTTYPFWVLNLFFLYLLLRNPARKPGSNLLRGAGWGLFAAILFLNSVSSIRGIANFRHTHDQLTAGRNELLTLKDNKRLELLYPRSDFVREQVTILKKYRLSVFRDMEERSGTRRGTRR